MSINISCIDLSRSRVRYNGRVLDKCALSNLVHDVGVMACLDTTYTDIYWYFFKYSELVDRFKLYLSELS